MLPKGLRWAPFLALALTAFHCGVGSPEIHNALGRTIQLDVSYDNGRSVSGEIPPGATASAPRGADGLERLRVRSDGELLFDLGEDDIDRLTSRLAPDARVIWEVGEDGVVLIVEPD